MSERKITLEGEDKKNFLRAFAGAQARQLDGREDDSEGAEPQKNADDFVDFLTWLVMDKGFDAMGVIYVVEKPYKFADEYREYLAGGADR